MSRAVVHDPKDAASRFIGLLSHDFAHKPIDGSNSTFDFTAAEDFCSMGHPRPPDRSRQRNHSASEGRLVRSQDHEPGRSGRRADRRLDDKAVRVRLPIRREVVGLSSEGFHVGDQQVEVARCDNLRGVVEVDVHRQRRSRSGAEDDHKASRKDISKARCGDAHSSCDSRA